MTEHIVIGNTAQQNDSGTWDWTFYVRPDEYIEEVVVTLHPTFRNPVRTLRGPKLELSCSGWGTFELQVAIAWRGGGQLNTKWMLRFDPHQLDFHETIEVPVTVFSQASLHNSPQQPLDSVPAGFLQPMDLSSSRDSVPAASGENDRLALLETLSATPAIDPGIDPLGQTWHGRLVQQELPRPRMTWQSQRRPREDKHGKQDAPEWLNASEYKDDIQALTYKVQILANLLRCSKKSLAYTGAGLSVAAGIEMAAVGSAKAKASSPLEADPTVAHCIMAELNKRNPGRSTVNLPVWAD